MIAEGLRPLVVPIDNLDTDPRNARRGDVAAIRRSLNVFGQRKPVVVKRTGTDANGRPSGIVIAGNHTLLAARELGWPEVAAVFVDDDAATSAAYALADNRTGELAEWDEAQLADTLRELVTDNFDMTALGWSDTDLAAILADPGEVSGDPDAAPPLAPPGAPTVTQPGDIWQLAQHRLLVGDATDIDAVKRLLGSECCHVMWTDPPYGVDYVGGYSHQYSPKERLAMGGQTLQNDGELDLPALLTGFLAVAGETLRPGAPAYVAHPSGPLSMVFGQHIEQAGWLLRQQLIWVKDSLVMGRSDYHYRHEPVWMAYTPGGAGRLGRGGPAWFGDDSAQSVFEVARPKRSTEHPTMKPVELIKRMLANSCPPGGLVYDPFAGSGSTLIAAHVLGMAARLVELDPRYADVVCRRAQEATGTKPINAVTGEPHDFCAETPVATGGKAGDR